MIVNVHQAKARLSELLERAVRGEDIVIAKHGKALVRLMRVEDRAPRCPGIAKGTLTDAFFEPLPDEELEAWEQ